ncbi:MAG TPA: M48 family metallopeptidase [Acidimicrobiales bacterium]|nr:M48 family metallopeptidase [Acidimicrobiales bacterium]
MTTITAPGGTTIKPSRSGISPWRAFPAKPEDWFDPDEIAKAKRYLKPIRAVSVAQKTLVFLVDLWIVGFHLMPKLFEALNITNWVFQVVAVIIATDLIGTALNFGFSWWRTMVYDKKWEFSTTTAGTFFSDLLKGTVLGWVIGSLLLIPLWAVVRATDLWWFYGWILISVLSVGIGLLAPKIIFPLFNKYTPLADEELHQDLLRVAKHVGADVRKVEVEDASKRDNRDNAYVAGAGKVRRLVLFDTILDRPREQIRWVCAHELGHWKLRHIVRMVPVAVAMLLVNFVFLKLVLESDWALRFAGVDGTGPFYGGGLGNPGAIPLFMLVFGLPGLLTNLVTSYVSRAAEREADLFGLEAVPEPEAASASLRNLHTDNLADLAPSLWKRLNHSHPPVAERLALIREWERRSNASAS